MAASELTVQQIVDTGLEAAAAASANADGNYFINNGRTYIRITDTGTTAPTMTVASQVECSQGETHDVDVVVQSGEARLAGPFPTDRFNDEDGYVQMTYDDNTDVTVEVFSL